VTSWTVEGIRSTVGDFDLGPVNLDLGPGGAVAVLGPSGAGKTTLLRTIAGFVPARHGRLLRDGVDVTRWPPERRGLGYVPQGLGLFTHRTVERNVSYPLEVRGRTDALRASRPLLERFGLATLARRYPAQLSGGELQRVALARALAAEPALVLWDEPWQALDVEARHQLSLVFEELRSGARIPVLIVTHDPSLAFSVADRFLVLRAGAPRFHGEPGALLQRPFDRFTARFAGYENVFDRPSLAQGGPGSLAAWLDARAGPGGVAFPRPAPALDPAAPGSWEGVVRVVRPTPEGLALTVAVGPVGVALRQPSTADGRLPGVGDRLRFDVEEKSLRPLEAEDEASGAAG